MTLIIKDSADENVSTVGVKQSTRRKRSTVNAVTEAESRFRHKDIAGTVAVGRQGLVTS